MSVPCPDCGVGTLEVPLEEFDHGDDETMYCSRGECFGVWNDGQLAYVVRYPEQHKHLEGLAALQEYVLRRAQAEGGKPE